MRRPVRVTGIRSGLEAARKEFGYGVYDGFTGVVRLPVRGAKNEGVVGFAKGTGMGLMGLVLKNVSAIVGPFGYTLKGVVKQVERRKQPFKYVRRGRIIQGQREANKLDEKEKASMQKQAVDNWGLLKELENEIASGDGQRGIVGQFDKVLLDTSVLYEDIDDAREALQALKSGESLEQVTRKVLGIEDESKTADGRHSKHIRGSLNLGSKSRKSLSGLSSRSRKSLSGMSNKSRKSLSSPTPRDSVSSPTRQRNGSVDGLSSKSRQSLRSPNREEPRRTLSSTVEGDERNGL